MKRKKNYTKNSPFFNSKKGFKNALNSNGKQLNIDITTYSKNQSDYDFDLFFNTTKISTPRLLAACKDLNIGRETLIEFLFDKGYSVNSENPNTKLETGMYIDLLLEFAPNKLKEYRNKDLTITQFENTVIISINHNGRLIVRQETNDGTIVYSNGIENKSNIFLPIFTTQTSVLNELEELINDPNVLENDLQKFIESHPELILNDDYSKAIPQASIVYEGHNWEADFALIPFDQSSFSTIAELKLPQEKIYNQNEMKNGHMNLSSKLLHFVQQIRDYYKAFDEEKTRNHFKQKYGHEIYKPSLQLIIGRSGDMKLDKPFIDFQRTNEVSIVSWDSFLESNRRKLL